MKCNLIVAGFGKCGTSSFHTLLDMHEQICMSSIKEPHYFSHPDVYGRGEAWHDQLFTDHGQHRYYGESSTSYCYDPEALDRIQQDAPNVKLFLVLRQPLERLLSHYRWLWAQDLERRPIVEAVKAEDRKGYSILNPVPGSGNYASYLRSSNYSKYVPLIQQKFGENNVHLVHSESLRSSIESEMRKCFGFLELDPIPVTGGVQLNTTADTSYQRGRGLVRIMRRIPGPVRQALDPGGKIRPRLERLLGRKQNAPPSVSSAELDTLQEMLAEDLAFYDRLFLPR